MAEKGFRRTSKKCREKFDNVYKYHQRSKDGRSSQSDGKTYRFSDQIEALESSHPSSPTFAVPITMLMPPPRPPAQQPLTIAQPPLSISTAIHLTQPAPAPISNAICINPTPLSSTSSDMEIIEMKSRRKRKWKDLFLKLTEDAMKKQDELGKKFMEELDRRENEHRIREESWKTNLIARLKQQREILLQERSMASAKEAALMSYLQKLSNDKQIPLPPEILLQPQPPPPTTPTFRVTPIPKPQPLVPEESAQIQSKWRKEEINALIKLRANMEHKYQQEGVPKWPLWEEISGSMKTMGYNRNAKRCKEKWENINNYDRRVKEKNKKPWVDPKTSPFYYQFDALYSGANSVKPPAAFTAEQNDEDGYYDDEMELDD